MSEPQSVQFDRVEYQPGAAQATVCAHCRQPIVQSYYEVNGNLICSQCRDVLADGAAAGSRAVRIGRAAAAGFGAAIIGAIVWWGVRKLTGYEVGLISIAIGIGVGKAVRWGSRNRGGWAYQLLAILLTYAAVAGNYMPDTLEAIREQGKKDEAAAAKSTPPAATPSAPAPKAVQAKSVTKAEPMSIGVLLLGFVLIFLLAAAVPFMSGLNNFVGIAIIAFGLYEAWKINKRTPLGAINGPFSVVPPAPNV